MSINPISKFFFIAIFLSLDTSDILKSNMIHHSTTPPIRVTQESLNLITHNQVLNVGAFHTTSNFNMLLPASQS